MCYGKASEFNFTRQKVTVFQERLNSRVHIAAVVGENLLNFIFIILYKSVHGFLLLI
jgi:hypothetical protein